MCDAEDAQLSARAQSGDAQAQYELGEALASRGSLLKAARWFEAAAKQGHARATFRFARALLRGEGIAHDVRAAMKWLRKAADAEEPEAMFELAGLLEHGTHVVKRDRKGAFELTLRSAQLGFAKAMNSVAVSYDSGDGVQQSDELAAAWYRKAADLGVASSQYNLGVMYKDGQGLQQSSSEAVRWWRLAAAQGHELAMHSLGVALIHGSGVPAPDPAKGVSWLRKASRRGCTKATFMLADILANGAHCIPADVQESQRLFARLGSQGGGGGILGAMSAIVGSHVPCADSENIPLQRQAQDACLACGRTGTAQAPLKACSRCQWARFCSRECQKAAWKKHKRECGEHVDETANAQQVAREVAAEGDDTPMAQLSRDFVENVVLGGRKLPTHHVH